MLRVGWEPWVYVRYIYFLIVLMNGWAGRVDTQRKKGNPLPSRNPKKYKNEIRIRPNKSSQAGGRVIGSAGFVGWVGFHG